jgi:hypothetical protein
MAEGAPSSGCAARTASARAGYAKLREKLAGIEVEDAQGWKALADAVLALDRD